MCKFKSAIVTRTGELYHSELTDSHTDIIDLYGLKEGKSGQNFVRVEFTPNDFKTIDDPATYSLKVDEDSIPKWFDDDLRADVVKKLSALVRQMVVSDERKILAGGEYILIDGAKVDRAILCRIHCMRGGTLTEMRGGTLTTMCGGTLTTMCGGTLTEMWGGTLPEKIDKRAIVPEPYKLRQA